ncbi:MAG: hypothetical protein Q9183_005648, partial [Haloplaca sp. 2 TL-2023]
DSVILSATSTVNATNDHGDTVSLIVPDLALNTTNEEAAARQKGFLSGYKDGWAVGEAVQHPGITNLPADDGSAFGVGFWVAMLLPACAFLCICVAVIENIGKSSRGCVRTALREHQDQQQRLANIERHRPWNTRAPTQLGTHDIELGNEEVKEEDAATSSEDEPLSMEQNTPTDSSNEHSSTEGQKAEVLWDADGEQARHSAS